jgi:hypothetical protein
LLDVYADTSLLHVQPSGDCSSGYYEISGAQSMTMRLCEVDYVQPFVVHHSYVSGGKFELLVLSVCLSVTIKIARSGNLGDL